MSSVEGECALWKGKRERGCVLGEGKGGERKRGIEEKGRLLSASLSLISFRRREEKRRGEKKREGRKSTNVASHATPPLLCSTPFRPVVPRCPARRRLRAERPVLDAAGRRRRLKTFHEMLKRDCSVPDPHPQLDAQLAKIGRQGPQGRAARRRRGDDGRARREAKGEGRRG